MSTGNMDDRCLHKRMRPAWKKLVWLPVLLDAALLQQLIFEHRLYEVKALDLAFISESMVLRVYRVFSEDAAKAWHGFALH